MRVTAMILVPPRVAEQCNVLYALCVVAVGGGPKPIAYCPGAFRVAYQRERRAGRRRSDTAYLLVEVCGSLLHISGDGPINDGIGDVPSCRCGIDDVSELRLLVSLRSVVESLLDCNDRRRCLVRIIGSWTLVH